MFKTKEENVVKQIGYTENPHSNETKHVCSRRADKERLQQKRGEGRIQFVT